MAFELEDNEQKIVAEAMRGVLEAFDKINPEILMTTKFEFFTEKIMDMSLTEAAKYVQDFTKFANKVYAYHMGIGLILKSMTGVYKTIANTEIEPQVTVTEITPEAVASVDQTVSKQLINKGGKVFVNEKKDVVVKAVSPKKQEQKTKNDPAITGIEEEEGKGGWGEGEE